MRGTSAAAQRVRLLEELGSAVAHDLQNVLAIILGYSDIAEADLKDGEPVGAHIGEIERAAKRAATLCRRLLLFSSEEPGDTVALDLNEVAKGAEKMLSRLLAQRGKLILRTSPEPAWVQSDAACLWQLLAHLAVVARDAMPAGEDLRIEIGARSIAKTRYRLLAGDYIRLSVHAPCLLPPDSKALLKRAFLRIAGGDTKAFTTHPLFSHCGGHLELKANARNGAVFHIYFPAAKAPP